MSQENPNLKFTRLPDDVVLELVQNAATDAQWDLNSAKSPKGHRDAQNSLNLFGSILEMLKGGTK